MENIGSEDEKKSVRFSWLESELIPKIIEALGKTGEDYKYDIKVPEDCCFISSLYMTEVTFSKSGEKKRLVIKVQPENEATRIFLRTDILFGNEINFYEQFGKLSTAYPKCVLTIPDTAIVLEDIRDFGYEMKPSSEELGMQHALAAVREIGRFHARGYVMKENDEAGFFRLVESLRDSRYDDYVHPQIKITNGISVRPIKYLKSLNYDPVFCDRMLTLLENAHESILKDCVKPRNHLAVLCHGDFTVNNVLFRDDGDAKLIDFAQVRYSSPATDISIFLYISCGEEIRKRFNDIFKAYHETVVEHLKDQGVRDLDRYSYDAFLNDYKRHAVFGCGVALFFIPITHYKGEQDFNDVMKNFQKYVDILMLCGGEEMTKKLAVMMLEMKSMGCLDHLM